LSQNIQFWLKIEENLTDIHRVTKLLSYRYKLTIASASHKAGLKMAYIAYTCHLFGDCIQDSILAENEDILTKHITEEINKMTGVLKSTVNPIVKTWSLASYDEWKENSSKHRIALSWDEESMINQFQE
jgi:hypothetical protein